MKCAEFREAVFELVSGELDESRTAAAKEHMSNCAQCRREYEAAVEMMDALKEFGETQAPPQLLPNVMNAVKNEKARQRFSYIKYAASAAAALVLVVGAVKVLPGIVKSPAEISPDSAQTNSLTEENTDTSGDTSGETPMTASLENDESAIVGEVQPIDGEETVQSGETESNPAKAAKEVSESKDMLPKNDKLPTTKNTDSARTSSSAETAKDTAPSNNSKNEAFDTVTNGNTAVQDRESKDASSADITPEAIKPVINSSEPKSQAEVPNDSNKTVSDVFGGLSESLDQDSSMPTALDDEDGGSPYGIRKGSSGGGSGGSSSEAGNGSGGFQIITAGLGDEPVVETAERDFIHRTCRFTVESQFAEAVKNIETKGKTMAQVSAELDSLGVLYEIYVIEDEYTAEYRAANPERRSEIEALCSAEDCEIVVK